jgi:hypothetical protein
MKRTTFFADERLTDELKEIACEERKALASIAERLKIAKILITDRRHFSIVKGRDGRPCTPLP